MVDWDLIGQVGPGIPGEEDDGPSYSPRRPRRKQFTRHYHLEVDPGDTDLNEVERKMSKETRRRRMNDTWLGDEPDEDFENVPDTTWIFPEGTSCFN